MVINIQFAEITLFSYTLRIVNNKLWNMDGKYLLRMEKKK